MRSPKVLLLAAMLAASTGARGATLLDYYESALRTNPEYRISEFGVDQARAERDIYLSRLLPQVTASGSYSSNDSHDSRSTDIYDSQREALQVRLALLDLTSYFRFTSAKLAVEQSKYQREAARMDLGGLVVEHYLAALQARDELEYLTAEKLATQREMERLRVMRERQLAKITDLLEVEAYYQELLTNEIQARAVLSVAIEQLRETSGLTSGDPAPLVRTEFDPIDRDEAAWVQDATSNNWTLAALRRAIEAAHDLVNSTRSEHLPQVALVGSTVRSDQGVDNRLSPKFEISTVSLQVTIPLYEGGRVTGSIEDARAKWNIAREQYERAARQITREARTAFLTARASHARISSTGEEVKALERVVDAQRKSYQLGVTTIVDVVVAQRRLLRARYDQSKARYEFIRERAALRVRAGALSRADLEEMDGWLAHGGEAKEDSTPAVVPDAGAPAPDAAVPPAAGPDAAAAPAATAPEPLAFARDPWIQVSPHAE